MFDEILTAIIVVRRIIFAFKMSTLCLFVYIYDFSIISALATRCFIRFMA